MERRVGIVEIDYKAIGQRIKIARIKKGMTQEVVSYMVDVTPAHMSNIETGKTKVSLSTLIAIANALSVSVDALLCDNVLNVKVIFEIEAKELFSDCDEYEIRLLVDILKSAKKAIRKDRKVRNMFEM
jgi:transcriptional regulator with XRE-family HTH domain